MPRPPAWFVVAMRAELAVSDAAIVAALRQAGRLAWGTNGPGLPLPASSWADDREQVIFACLCTHFATQTT